MFKLANREQFDRIGEALQLVLARRASRELRLSLVEDGAGYEDLAGLRGRLRSRGGVHDCANGRHVSMGLAKLAEAQFPGVDPNADAKRRSGQSERLIERRPLLGKPTLDLASRMQGARRMVAVGDREIEHGHHRVANRLVEDAVLFPYGAGADVIEHVQQAG